MKDKWSMMPFLAADGGGAGGDGDPASPDPQGEQKQSFEDILKNETYKQDFDVLVKQAIDTEKATWEQAAQDAAAAKKMEELPDDQKADALLQAEKQRADKLQAEKDAILLKQTATSLLSEKELPIEAADFVIGKDEDTTKANVESFNAMFAAAVAKTVKDKLPGYTPKSGTNVSGSDASGFINVIRENQAKRK